MLDVNELSKATVDDLAANPKKYGMPTLSEFMKSPALYKSALLPDELLAQIERGSQTLNRHVASHEYFVGSYKCDSLEMAQRVMHDMGMNVTAAMMKPEIVDLGAGKCKIKVTFKIPDDDETAKPTP